MYTTTIFSETGILLWKSSTVEKQVPLSVFNDAISAKIQGKPFSSQTFTVKIVPNHELKVSCAIAYPSVISVKTPEALASDLLKILVSMCGDDLRNNNSPDLSRFSELAQLRLQEYAVSAVPSSKGPEKVSTSGASASATTASAGALDSGGETPRAATPKSKKKKPTKKARKWDGSNSDDDSVTLDYSEPPSARDLGATEQVDSSELGERTALGFQVKSLENELDAILSSDEPGSAAPKSRFSFIQNYVGGKKLTDEDLNKALNKMEDSLVRKNVTKDIAHDICQQVRHDLVGATTSTWTSVNATVQASMSRILSKILTPNSSNDLLVEIQQAKAKQRLYVMSIVGVNGVGKSTNLGKIAFWLLQNNFKVLIAACDTFRSGAVEQLRVHVQRLEQLAQRQAAGTVELFDQGYGKDAAVIAKKAVEYGEKHGFDIVLIDTAGRRHNDQRLMSSLEKFGKLANPDKIIMVGEALVGTDSVEQARNFNAAFGHARNIDFFLISKCDTVGDMLGTLVNMTSSTGIPVLFVGVGQNYTDLRTLSVDWAVRLLLS